MEVQVRGNNVEKALRILKKNSAWVLRYLNVADNEINRAFEVAEQNKSVLLMDLSK